MQRILVGFDGSEQAQNALGQAIRLAKQFGATLTVLTAAADRLVRSDGMLTVAADEEAGQHCAEEGARQAREAGISGVETRVSLEAPDDALAAEAANGYDLLVVGHRGVGALQELFLGSTAKSVVDRVRCSVLVVR